MVQKVTSAISYISLTGRRIVRWGSITAPVGAHSDVASSSTSAAAAGQALLLLLLLVV